MNAPLLELLKPGQANILQTRPIRQSDSLQTLLRQNGLRPISMPMLEIQALRIPRAYFPSGGSRPSEYESDTLTTVDLSILEKLGANSSTADAQISRALFVSANAVHYTAKALNASGIEGRSLLRDIPCLGMGGASAAAIEDQGWFLDREYGDQLPSAYTTEVLMSSPWANSLNGDHVLIARGRGGRNRLVDELRDRAAAVSVLETYRRSAPHYTEDEKRALYRWLIENKEARCVLLGSADTAVNFLQILEPLLQTLSRNAEQISVPCHLLVPSQRVASELEQMLARLPECEMIFSSKNRILLAENASDAAMAAEALRWLRTVQ